MREIRENPITIGELIEILKKFDSEGMIFVYDEGCATNLYEVYYDGDNAYLG